MRISSCGVLAALLLTSAGWAGEALGPGQWSVDRANAWYATQPWLVGCNFLPSSAVNDVEMWRKETFDPKTMERELDMARGLGFNTVRVFINFVAWEEDPAGLRERFGQFLHICARRGILVMPVLLDDCNFAGREAAATPQPDPVPGVHNSQWVSSPPLKRVADRAAWPRIEKYVTDMVGAFGKERRIVVWDLYNEPGNSGMGEKSLPLVEAAFEWARKCNPKQPLTVAPWADFNSPMSRRLFELSDVISFHGYDNAGGIRAKIKRCAEYGRPILCTEYLHRQSGNTFQTILPIFREANVGAYNWSLVAGRTQTYFPWGSPKDAPEPAIWQHDIFRRDGTPFSDREVLWLKRFMGRMPAAAMVEVVPTARRQAVEWRYTLDDPGEGWMRPGFDDSKWKVGPAPFGKDEPPIGRAPRTQWTTQRIWVRRTFDLPDGKLADPVLLMHYDEDPEVYLNGVLAARPGQYTAEYVELPIAPEAAATLKPGKNTLAVLCRQTWGGQFIDVGIAAAGAESKASNADPARWPAEKAWRWYDAQPWPVGFNYVPANAISYTEMWMDYAFDEALIDRELALAQGMGFNCLRVVLPFVVWEAEPEAFKKRLDAFAALCARRGIRVMFALFDDCAFGPIVDPKFERQPAVVPGWYANGWTPSPGHAMVRDPRTWPRLERYVKDVIGTFKDDPRVWVWDLYNEPTNSPGDVSIPLVEKTFDWARSVNPSQPLTIGVWNGNAKLNRIAADRSDITTFHNYHPADGLAKHVESLRRLGRPIICTEWLNRGAKSLPASSLPIFRRDSIGCMHWGLVNGKTQTHLNWGHRPGQPDPPVWQHDLFRPDHAPYDPAEIDLFKRFTGGAAASTAAGLTP